MTNEPELRLLLEWEDERQRSRRRESVFLSVIVHLGVIIFLLIQPNFFRNARQALGMPVEEPKPRRQLTYLAGPPDDQVVKVKPKNAPPSDKDRIAQAPKLPPVPKPPPEPTPEEKPVRSPEKEKQLLAQAIPPPVAAPQPGAEARQPAPQGQPGAPPLQLENVRPEAPKLAVPPATAGRSLEETLRGLARNRGGGQTVGDPIEGGQGTFNPRQPAAVGEARILSDTQGVDFDPYLRRVVADIRRNWYAVMPEIARMGKRGRVIVIFEILRDGGVPKLYLVSTSGSEPLDRAALAGISASAPFPPLPGEFRGPMVRLQVTFLYNMFYEQ